MAQKWEYQLQLYTLITIILSEARHVVRASLRASFVYLLFFVLSHAPSLCSRSKETSTSRSTDDILNDPLLSQRQGFSFMLYIFLPF